MTDAPNDTIIAVLPKNRTEELRVSLTKFNGHDLVQQRVFFEGSDGQKRPGKQGLSLRVAQLPDLIAALQAAADEARLRGLLQ